MAAKGRGGGKTPTRVVELLRESVKQTSQAATARATGLTLQTVQRYIKGIGEPSQATLQKLSDYFDASVAWLRGDDIPNFWVRKDLYAGGTDIADPNDNYVVNTSLAECAKCGNKLKIYSQTGNTSHTLIKLWPCETCCKQVV